MGSEVLGEIIKLIVPRGEGSLLQESGRGVTLLATEPARAGVELALIYLINRVIESDNSRSIVADLLLFLSSLLICFLNSPQFVEISNSSCNLMWILNEGVIFFKFNFVYLIFLLSSEIKPGVVDTLCFLHEGSDSIDGVIVTWLVVGDFSLKLNIWCSFSNCLIVQDIVLIVILSLVHDNDAISFLDFNVPRII